MKRLAQLPPYTVAVSVLVLALMVYALAKGDPLGYVLATVLVLFIGVPTVVIWTLSRRDARRDALGERAASVRGDADPLTWPPTD